MAHKHADEDDIFIAASILPRKGGKGAASGNRVWTYRIIVTS